MRGIILSTKMKYTSNIFQVQFAINSRENRFTENFRLKFYMYIKEYR